MPTITDLRACAQCSRRRMIAQKRGTAAIADFKAEHGPQWSQWSQEMRNKADDYLALQVEHFGPDRPMDQISRQDAADVKKLVQALPANRRTKPETRDLSLQDAIAVPGLPKMPQLSFEVFRPLADPDTAEGLTRAVTMIPASGQFTYAPTGIRKGSGGAQTPENLNALSDTADMVVALDRLQAMAPAVESVSLVVAWFGDDLRAGSCKVRPGVEVSAKSTTPVSWSVNGVSRANAFLVSRDAEDRPVYGGTSSDFAVVQAIQEMKARGLRVTFYPFILMDVPPGNSLPNPFSDNAAETGRPVFPWRGRITCSPAAGFAGTVDKTATAAAQVAALFGAATPASFNVSGQSVSWTGTPGDWGLRRVVLHYAHLCAAAGGVDAFLIGTEMPGLTTIRSGASTYPAVQAYRDLLADVRSILGSGTKIGYAADWSEYFGHQPGDGSGDVFFHLDPLWADPEIDFVGIDNYMPLSDWRDGFEHADAADGWPAIYDRAYLQGNIAGGEGFDWFYASAADRSAQVRTPISDGAAGKPWVLRYKDLRAWWSCTTRCSALPSASLRMRRQRARRAPYTRRAACGQ